MTLTLEKARAFGRQKPVEIGVKEVELTAQQVRLWEQTRAKFLSDAPGFTFILYQMMNPKRKQLHAVFTNDPSVPVAATDGLYVYLNVDTWFKYTLSERVFILAHEVVHAILNHAITMHMYRRAGKLSSTAGKSMEWDENTAQQAADCIINDMLVESRIGSMPKDACYNKDLITHKDGFVTAYEKLYRRKKGGGSGGGGGFDKVLPPGMGEGKDPGQAAGERNEQEWKTATAAAMATAKAQGKLSASMRSVFEEVLEPQVSWQDYITGFFARRLGGGAYNFRRADRRFMVRDIFAPSRSGHAADTVVVAIDTSGSIGDKTVAMFLGEVSGVLADVRPRDLYVVWCDAKVRRVDMAEDVGDLAEMRRKGAPGRGGTDFRPVFEWVKEMGFKPDALLYLTDLLGAFPSSAPDYPVLWGATMKGKVPFGETVEVPNADR